MPTCEFIRLVTQLFWHNTLKGILEMGPPHPKVAIITRTKDRSILLRRALDSVSRQTYDNFKWIIVNDGGIPDPVDTIASHARKNGVAVAVIHNSESKGMEAASNIGIRSCSSEHILIHDDDDSLEPLFLEKTVGFLDENINYHGVITHSYRIDEFLKNNTCKIVRRYPFNPWVQGIFLSDMVARNIFPPISFLFKRSVYDELNGFDETLPVLGDWDFNLRFLMKYDIGVVPDLLSNYHHRINISEPDNVYGNSLYSNQSKHAEYDALIRNKLLRNDLIHGNLGLGLLISAGRYHRIQTDTLFSIVDSIKKTFVKLPFAHLFRR